MMNVVSVALITWTAIAFLLVRRAQARAVGFTSKPWLPLIGALAVGTLAISLRPLPQAATCGIACIALVIAADADARTGYLFDAITLPTAVLVMILASATGMGVSAGLGCALLVVTFGAVAAVSRGRAMGYGDVKAMASIGAAFGPSESALAIVAACGTGILEAALRSRLHRSAEIRFGPHLAIGAAFALVGGRPLIRFLMEG